MLLDLFFTFLKINFLTTSGPASIGLTKQLVVPTFITEEKFTQIIAIASEVPGSDAIQIAWQIGYCVNGFIGSIISVIPCITLATIVSFGLKFFDPTLMSKFFRCKSSFGGYVNYYCVQSF